MKENLRGTKLLNTQLGQPLALVNGLLQGLALDNTSQQTTSKGVTSSVSVVDESRVDGADRELLDLVLALDSDQSRLGALSDNGNTLPLGVLLGKVGQSLDYVPGLLGRKVVGHSIGLGLGLIADDVVPVRGAGVDDLLEELGDEGSRETRRRSCSSRRLPQQGP